MHLIPSFTRAPQYLRKGLWRRKVKTETKSSTRSYSLSFVRVEKDIKLFDLSNWTKNGGGGVVEKIDLIFFLADQIKYKDVVVVINITYLLNIIVQKKGMRMRLDNNITLVSRPDLNYWQIGWIWKSSPHTPRTISVSSTIVSRPLSSPVTRTMS